MDPRIALLEEMAFAAWPAAEVVEIGGWRCRHTPPRVTRRGNSVWPCTFGESWELDQQLARVEHYYAARDVPALFHVSPLAQPAGLDAELADRGWSHEAAVSMQIAESAAVASKARRSALAAVSGPAGTEVSNAEPGADWLAVALHRSRFAATPEAFRGILARVASSAGFALVRSGEVPVATGLGVRQGDWAGLFAMLTVPEARRQGHARALLGALAGWAERNGARWLYLQVERDNPAALALYRGCGFRELYGYHYRRAPASVGP